MSFMQMLEAELATSHGRDHPMFTYWMQNVAVAVSHQWRLLQVASTLTGVSLEDKAVLDLGCGTGAACLAFARLGARQIYGVDLRLGGLGLRLAQARMREEGVDAQLMAADAGHLPLRSASVDFCFCDQVVEHVPDSSAVFAEIWRVLKPGGGAYIGAPNRLSPIEGHTGLWGAHWLPHQLCERYVKWRGLRAEDDVWDVRTRTYWTLTRQLRRQDFVVVGSLSNFLPVWQQRWQGPKRLLADLYMHTAKIARSVDALAPIIALAIIKRG